ncbi:hypothetical protein S83_032674, partial [Arachis hypogaea]
MFASKLGFNLDIPEVAAFWKRVKVLVEDSTGISIFVLFDREASYLLNKTCAQLFEQHLKNADVLSRPIGMEKFKGTYPMRHVCDDVAILGMFELFGLDLSPKKVGFVPKEKGSFEKPSKCPLLNRKSVDAVVDKLNEVDSSENSCDEVDESEE